MLKAGVYIDGFNLYHALNNLGDDRLKWLDLMKLSSNLGKEHSFVPHRVVWCSALPTHRKSKHPEAFQRHEIYKTALEYSGVDCVMGTFKKKVDQTKCHKCNNKWPTHEEKESDINLAMELVKDVFEGNIETALVITSDSDLGAAAKMLKQTHPEFKLIAASPPKRRVPNRISDFADKSFAISIQNIERSLFGKKVENSLTGKSVKKPASYR